jgi:hypothetical protein
MQAPPSKVIDLTRDDGLGPETLGHVSRHIIQNVQVELEAQQVRKRRGGTSSRRNKQYARSNVPALNTAELEGVTKWLADNLPQHEASLQLTDRTRRDRADVSDSELRERRLIGTTNRLMDSVIDKPSPIAPTSQVMFTLRQARLFLERAVQGGASRSHPPYTLQTGEYVPYPITKSYHLGAMGRYGNLPLQAVPRNADQDSAEYVFDWGTNVGKRISEVPRVYIEINLASPRLDKLLEEHRGLLEALQLHAPRHPRLALALLPAQPNFFPPHAPAHAHKAFTRNESGHLARRYLPSGTIGQTLAPAMEGNPKTQPRPSKPEPYTLTFGRYRGKMLEQVPISYIRTLKRSLEDWDSHAGLKEALAANYRFDFGK